MFRFSIAELMIVVMAVGVAAGGIALPTEEERAAALVAATMLGFTIAGPPLLWWRRRAGTLVGRWGLGELAWFYLGIYFTPLVLWGVVTRVSKANAESWLVVGFVMGAAVSVAAMILGGVRLLMRLLGTPVRSGRDWFIRRGTNLVGLAILLLYTCGIGTMLAWRFGWLPFGA